LHKIAFKHITSSLTTEHQTPHYSGSRSS